MAQLSDDCFAVGEAPMTIEEAVALVGRRVCTVAGIETVPLAQADGRICAQDCRAPGDLPPFDNAAVDGYAVRHAALAPDCETVLPLSGRLTAGASAQGVLAGDTAVRIFTGAPMPRDADTVFMQEDVRTEGGRIVLPHGLKPGANRRRAGEDVSRGDLVIPAGRRLRPQDLALAAATGFDRLAVRSPTDRALLHRRRTDRAGLGSAPRCDPRFEPYHARRSAAPPRGRGRGSRHSP